MRMLTQKGLFSGFITSLAIFVQGCGSSGTTVTLAAVTPIVKSSLPAALVPGATAAVTYHEIRPGQLNASTFSATSQMSIASNYITNMFQNYYAVGLTSNIQGYILAQTEVIDNRSTLYSGQSTSSHSCLGATTQPYTIDFSSVSSVLKFVLGDVSCTALFTGAQGSTGGSGEVFGVNGSTNSVWVTVSDMAGDPLATGSLTSLIAANVTNNGSTSTSSPETVDGLVLNYNGSGSPSSSNTYTFARFKAVPTNKTFEMYYTSNQATQGSFAGANASAGNGISNNMGPGYRIISDGNYIYADGVLCSDYTGNGDVAGFLCQSGTGSTTIANSGTLSMSISGNSNWEIFQVCMNAATMAVVDPTDSSNTCKTLANAFTVSPNATTFTTQGIFTSGGNPVTQDLLLFTNITGDQDLTDTAQMTMPSKAQLTSAQLTALTANYKASAASSVTSSY